MYGIYNATQLKSQIMDMSDKIIGEQIPLFS